LLTRRIPLRTTTVRAGTAHRPALADNIGARLAHGRDDPFDVRPHAGRQGEGLEQVEVAAQRASISMLI
jgi:hypothetical protein